MNDHRTLAAARKTARRMARATGTSYQTCLDIVASESGGHHWGDLLARRAGGATASADRGSVTPIVMYRHSDPALCAELAPEPFPAIRREIVRHPDGREPFHTTRYTLGSGASQDDVVSAGVVDRLDAAIDPPVCLMVIAHPPGTDVATVSRSLHMLAYWRGSMVAAPPCWRRGHDRLWTLHRFDPIRDTASHVIVRIGLGMQALEDASGAIAPWEYDHPVHQAVGAV